MKVLVTGGAGFIGSHLCEALLAAEHEVTAFDCLDDFYDPAIKRANLTVCAKSAHFQLIEADVRDAPALDAALAKKATDAIIHLAARTGVRPSIEKPLLYQDVNVHGTAVLLEAARKHSIKKLVFAGSSSVYGNNRTIPFRETDPVDHPISPYAATKKAGELLCHTYHHLFGINVTCLRLFTAYGPRQRPDLAIHRFTKLIEIGKPIPLFGDGTTSRDFTHVLDIVDGILRALKRCGGYHIYNLGNSRPISLNDLVAAIEQALGRTAILDRLPMQPGDASRTCADLTLAARELGYQPKWTLERGLAQFVTWFRAQRADAGSAKQKATLGLSNRAPPEFHST